MTDMFTYLKWRGFYFEFFVNNVDRVVLSTLSYICSVTYSL